MESILEKAFSSVLEGHNFRFFSPLSTHSMSKKSLGTALIISYFNDWNNYHLYYKETSSFLWKNQFFDKLTTGGPGICDPNKSWAQHDQSLKLGSNLKYLNIDQLLLSFFFFFNWDSLHARLNSHYEAWSYKKRSTKKITGYRKSV